MTAIYGDDLGARAAERLETLLDSFPQTTETGRERFSEADAVLITYGDSLRSEQEVPLATLNRFADTWFQDVFSAIHLLPFYPYSSDDGFSVIDFMRVNPELGDWPEIETLGSSFRLMFDYVLNHISAQSDWFRQYLNGAQGFENLAIEADPGEDLSAVTRPRSLPLLNPFQKQSGETVHVWTTFSADQVDLNYGSIDVLEKMVQVLLSYVDKGARLLRLDAVAYLWKEIGTSCIHRPQTHLMVKLLRRILDRVAPEVLIVTETNVPHEENIGYFGNGRDEAQLVYNFTLPPLLLHTFSVADATELSRWAETLRVPSGANSFFNFSASHDGIGLRPLEGILPTSAVDALVERVRANGGRVSTKRNPDGSDSPYELNITYIDALRDPDSDEDPLLPSRFLASQAIQLTLPGIPGIYIHSILGSRNWEAGVAETGRARTINREKLDAESVTAELKDPDGFRSAVFYPYAEMIRVRRSQPAFHPNAAFEIRHLHRGVFAIERSCPAQTLLALTNITAEPIRLSGLKLEDKQYCSDMISGQSIDPGRIELAPYQSLWLC